MNYHRKINGAKDSDNRIKLKRRKLLQKTVKGKLVTHSRQMNVQQGSADIRDPLYNPENMMFSNPSISFNPWVRHFDMTHPIVGNAIDIHAWLPISDFKIQEVDDPSIKQFYEDIKNDKVHLYEWLLSVSREYELLGEGLSYFGWNAYEGCFESATVLNPDLLEVDVSDEIGYNQFIISMKVPEKYKEVKRKSIQDPRYRDIWESYDPIIQQCVQSGKDIPLSENNVYGLQRLVHSYHDRGTSQVLRVIKDLLYEDKLRNAQMAVADGHITPIEHWTVGDISQGFKATQEDLDVYNQLIMEGEHQDFFHIVTPDYVKYETHSPTNGLLNIIPEIEQIHDRVREGLYVNKAMTTAEGPGFANAVVALKVLQGRYKNKLIRLENIMKDLYAKTAKAHGFVERADVEITNGIYKDRSNATLVVPDIGWTSSLDFQKDYDFISMLITLAEKNKVSWSKILDTLGVDEEEEKKKMEKQVNSILDDGYYQAKVDQIVNMVGGDKGANGGTGANTPPKDLTSAPSSPSMTKEQNGGVTRPETGSSDALKDMDMG